MKRNLILLTACSFLTACTDDNRGGMDGDGGGITDVPSGGGGSSGADDGWTDGTGDGGGGTGTGASDTGMDCGESNFAIDAVPPNVMLVLDKSGSMVKNLWDADGDPGTPDVTRWESLHNVVDFIVTSFDDKVNFGAVLFPSENATASYGAGACLVEDEPEVGVEPMNAQAVLAGIPAATEVDEIQGATPATKGVDTAVEHLGTLDPTIDQFMILVTDGAANCHGATANELMENYDITLPDTVAAASGAGIATYVVGIDILDQMTGVGTDGNPEANPFLELNKVAIEGAVPRPGPEKFYNAGNEIELQAALAEIAGEVVSCVIPLGDEPAQKHLLEIEIDGMTIEMVDDCTSEDGWVYVNPAGPYDVIELCGSACDLLSEFGALDATFLCPEAG